MNLIFMCALSYSTARGTQEWHNYFVNQLFFLSTEIEHDFP